MRNFTINNDFFNVNANNNILSLSYDTNLGITSPPIIQDTPLTLSIQNYNTTSQFTTEFNLQAGLAGITGVSTSFNDQTNLFTFNNSLGPTQVFNWNVQENQKFLGLSSGIHILGTTLLSDKTADLSGPDEINILLENIDLEAYNTTDYNKNILSTIPIETRFNEKIVYNNDYPVQSNNKNINRLRIKLTDEFGDLIQTSSDYTMNLQFIQDEIE